MRETKSWVPFILMLTSSMVSAFMSTSRSGRMAAAASTLLSSQVSSAVSSSLGDASCVNPFLEQEGTPKFSKVTPESLTPAVSMLLKQMEENFQELEAYLKSISSNGSVTYDDVLPRVERIQGPLEYAWGVAGHLKAVKDSEELRNVYQQSQPDVVKAFTKFSQSKPLYDALDNIQNGWGESSTDFLEQQKRRAVANSIRSMRLGGVALEGDAKERFNEIRLRLSELSTNFSNNVRFLT